MIDKDLYLRKRITESLIKSFDEASVNSDNILRDTFNTECDMLSSVYSLLKLSDYETYDKMYDYYYVKYSYNDMLNYFIDKEDYEICYILKSIKND